METPSRGRLVAGILFILGGLMLILRNAGWLDASAPWLWSGFFLLCSAAFLAFFLQDRTQWWPVIPLGAFASLALTLLCVALRDPFEPYAGAVLLLGLDITFLAVFLVDRAQWWALIPSGVLALLSAVVLFNEAPFIPDDWGSSLGGALFLGGLGLGFVLVYLANRDHWWAVIPGGCLLVLATAPILEQIPHANLWIPLVIFGGFAVVFAILHLATRQRWSLWVAAGLAAFALLIQALSGPTWFGGVLAGLLLIGAGAFFLWRTRAARS